MKQYKQILYSCVVLLFATFYGSQAQTKAIPDDPAMPHFITLESTEGGTLSGSCTVDNGDVISITEGKNFDLPHGAQIELKASPEAGKYLSRVTKMGADGKEVDLGLSDLPTRNVYTFNYTLEQSVMLKAHFAAQTYLVNWQLDHLTTNNQPTSIEHGAKFDFILTPEDGYGLPEEIAIGHWVEGQDFSYDPKTGEVKILIEIEYALTVAAKGVKTITASMKWDRFTGRYFETGKEGKAEYGIQASDRETPLRFRYIIEDYETWKGSLTMEYADNIEMNNKKPFNFSENGTVDILSTDCRSLPDAYNTYFRLTSTKAGKLLFKVEVYDEIGSRLYSTLNGGQILFADPVNLMVSPEIKGKVDDDIAFKITVNGLGSLSFEGEGVLGLNFYGGLKVGDLTLKYGDHPITLQEKGGILYGSTPVGTLGNERSYSFTLNSKVPLSQENKIELFLSDSYYVLPSKEDHYAYPEVVFAVEEIADDNLRLDIPAEIQENDPLEMKLNVADEDTYRLPSRITVMMGGKMLPSSAYSYNPSDGSIRIDKVTGNIKINAIAVGLDEIEVFYGLTGIDISPSKATMPKDQTLEFTLTARTNYELPASIKVEVDGTGLSAGTGYTYETGKLKIPVESLEGAKVLEIFAEGKWVKPEEPDQPVTLCDVVLPKLTGATTEPTAGTHQVKPGSDFSFRILLGEEYDQSTPIVKVNGQTVEPGANGYYTIRINGDVTISITGIVKNTTVGNAEVDSDALKVWGENGRLHILSAHPCTVYIATFAGRPYRIEALPTGESVIEVPQGAYIVRIGNQSYKIRF